MTKDTPQGSDKARNAFPSGFSFILAKNAFDYFCFIIEAKIKQKIMFAYIIRFFCANVNRFFRILSFATIFCFIFGQSAQSKMFCFSFPFFSQRTLDKFPFSGYNGKKDQMTEKTGRTG